jgi:hypothetical protein
VHCTRKFTDISTREGYVKSAVLQLLVLDGSAYMQIRHNCNFVVIVVIVVLQITVSMTEHSADHSLHDRTFCRSQFA